MYTLDPALQETISEHSRFSSVPAAARRSAALTVDKIT